MPDGFRGVDWYELVIADQSGTEVAKSTATGSVDAVVRGIVPGTYTITVKGYADIGGQPVLIIDDSQPSTVKEGMTDVSVAVSGIAEGTGTVDLTITADMPEGYTFADDAVTVRLYKGSDAVYTTTVGYTAADGVMSARLEEDIDAGVYTAEVQVDELYGRAMLYVLPGMTSTGTIAVNPMIAEKVATPVIGEVEGDEVTTWNENRGLIPKAQFGSTFDICNAADESIIVKILSEQDKSPVVYGSIKDKKLVIIGNGIEPGASFHIGASVEDIRDFDIYNDCERNNGKYYFTIPEDLANLNPLYFKSNGGVPVMVKNEVAPSSTKMVISCSTPDSNIYYMLDGSTPDLSSNLYTGPIEVEYGATIKVRAFKDGMIPSDVAEYTVEKPIVPVTVPMTLPDGSVLFYDRGEVYGSYHIGNDGYPVRDDGAVDDGSVESANWRYLITLPYDLSYYDSDYSGSWDERGRCSPYYSELAIGSGLSNSIRKRLRESSRLQAGDESRHHFPFWLSMYFLTVSADILPTDPM